MKYLFAQASISACGKYRYTLQRIWSYGPRRICWILLNPSTADGNVDDNTIRRVVGFSQRWGFHQAIVVNLFAFRATDPRELLEADDPVGPFNDHHIWKSAQCSEIVVAGWGSHGDYRGRDKRAELLISRIADLWCLGTTNAGAPKHPLYLAKDTKLSVYKNAEISLDVMMMMEEPHWMKLDVIANPTGRYGFCSLFGVACYLLKDGTIAAAHQVDGDGNLLGEALRDLSLAHLYPDGIIRRFGHNIGNTADIIFA